jgi:hypothetical protein
MNLIRVVLFIVPYTKSGIKSFIFNLNSIIPADTMNNFRIAAIVAGIIYPVGIIAGRDEIFSKVYGLKPGYSTHPG